MEGSLAGHGVICCVTGRLSTNDVSRATLRRSVTVAARKLRPPGRSIRISTVRAPAGTTSLGARGISHTA